MPSLSNTSFYLSLILYKAYLKDYSELAKATCLFNVSYIIILCKENASSSSSVIGK